MTLKFLQKILILLAGSILLFSCKKTLDINQDPTTPNSSQIQANLLFPSGTMFVASAVGGDLQLVGSIWAQHYTQGNTSNQYQVIDYYNISNSSTYSTRTWSLLYAGAIPDLDQTIQIAAKEGKWNYWVAATLIKAYTYHILTDTYGDVPFTEADKGTDVLAPKLDDSKTIIYPGIIKLIDDALAKMTDALNAEKSTPMGIADIVFGGKMANWEKFANTLKLKILMRDFTPNQTAITNLLTAKLLDKDASVAIFVDQPNQSNPLYENDQRKLNSKNNLRASETTLNYLQQYSDKRIPYYYMEGTIGKSLTPTYIGLAQGTGPGGQFPDISFSRALLKATDPVYFISLIETDFMQAECYAIKGDLINAKIWYDNGVKAAFARWGLDATAILTANYAFVATTTADALTQILTQKWLASVRCQAWNAFIDINRTGIPALGAFQVGATGYVWGTLVPTSGSVLGIGKYPKRMIYPKTSSDYNVNAAEAIKKTITDKLWWQS
ncbi:MAG: SusD/RagB family nutrient-binding outer membrane lipoprotein [Anaerovoracaceae bacterium]